MLDLNYRFAQRLTCAREREKERKCVQACTWMHDSYEFQIWKHIFVTSQLYSVNRPLFFKFFFFSVPYHTVHKNKWVCNVSKWKQWKNVCECGCTCVHMYACCPCFIKRHYLFQITNTFWKYIVFMLVFRVNHPGKSYCA